MSFNDGGWLTADPLENHSSLHQFSLFNWMGWKARWLKLPIYVQFNFNLITPFHINPQAHLIFKAQDESVPVDPHCCFSIQQLKRWRIPLSPHSSFDDFLSSLIRWHRCNYVQSEKMFKKHGCVATLIEDDWSEYAEKVYQLYSNVAKQHGDRLYDLRFFQTIAKRKDYKLICAWFEGEMVAMFVLQEELPFLHSICCGMDYHHSSKSYAYSWLHYELIRWAIDKKKYQYIDVGLTADHSKKGICFTPIPTRMDIYAKGPFSRCLLKCASKIVTATINADAKLKFYLKRRSLR